MINIGDWSATVQLSPYFSFRVFLQFCFQLSRIHEIKSIEIVLTTHASDTHLVYRISEWIGLILKMWSPNNGNPRKPRLRPEQLSMASNPTQCTALKQQKTTMIVSAFQAVKWLWGVRPCCRKNPAMAGRYAPSKKPNNGYEVEATVIVSPASELNVLMATVLHSSSWHPGVRRYGSPKPPPSAASQQLVSDPLATQTDRDFGWNLASV